MNEDLKGQFQTVLENAYVFANNAVSNETVPELLANVGNDEYASLAMKLAETKHACRGAAVTLSICKCIWFDKDIRNHKAEYEGGFSARGVDTHVTVPFLQSKGLPYNVETHWLSQTLSFAGSYTPDVVLKTTPKSAGPDFIKLVNYIQNAENVEQVMGIIYVLLAGLIIERNKGDIPLTKPKNLSIDNVMRLLHFHFTKSYKKNAPRLPQVAIYAIYQCLMNTVGRCSEMTLMPLERMKTANRKSGTVGDIDLHDSQDRPIEAVEIKYEIWINKSHVLEATQKVMSEAVARYFILSTKPVLEEDKEEIEKIKADFLQSNGCEIIVNGVYDTIKYYLRLLKSTNDFINNYTELLSNDPDLNFEHKIAWNAVCKEVLSNNATAD